MATRAEIWQEQEDGSWIGVYHHWDGGRRWLGKWLLENIGSDRQALTALLKGSISSLMVREGEEIKYQDEDVYTARSESEILSGLGGGIEYVYLQTVSGEWRYGSDANCWDLGPLF